MPTWSKSEYEAHMVKNRPKRAQDCVSQAFEPFSGVERQLHDLCLAEARRRRFYVVHSRTDQRTTQQKGVPDMIIAMPNGKTVWIELKVGKNKLSPEQEAAGMALRALGHDFRVCRSFSDFLYIVT